MSLDRSLKMGGGLAKHRNVLTRAERIEKLASKKKFNLDDGDPLSLPKVGNRKVATAKKSKKGPKEGEEGAEGAAAPAAAAPAPAAKAPAPKGGKK